MTISIKERTSFIFILAFIIVNLGAIISMKKPVQTGLLISILSIVSILVTSRIVINSTDILYRNVFNYFVITEIISCPMGLISQYGYFLQNNISLLLYGISFILLPQLLFFNLGRIIPNSKISICIKFLLKCNLFLVLIGIYFYIAQPQIYIKFIERALSDQFTVYGFSPRLVSYLGDSMSIGVICSASSILSLFFFSNKEKIVYTFVFAIGCIMSMQRGAWISMAFGTFLYIFVTHQIKLTKFIITRKLFYFILILTALIIYLIYKIQAEWAGDIKFFEIIIQRFDRIGGGADERSSLWIGVIKSSIHNIFGSGLGTLSHKGVNYGFPLTCPDGNYFRILGDIGFIGLLLFLLMNFLSLKNTYNKKEWPLFIVLIIFLMQAIGTNVFDLFYSSFIYWFILGLSNRKKIIIWNHPKK